MEESSKMKRSKACILCKRFIFVVLAIGIVCILKIGLENKSSFKDYTSIEIEGSVPNTAVEKSHETGLEFLSSWPNFEIGLENDTALSDLMDDIEEGNTSSANKAIQRFLKLLKANADDTDFDYNLVTGSDGKKQAWCVQPYQMRDLVQVEEKIYNVLRNYEPSENNMEFLFALKSYLTDFEESTQRALSYTDEKWQTFGKLSEDHYLFVASHPILVYRMIRRFAVDLQPIFWKIEALDEAVITQLYDEANPGNVIFPNDKDLADALSAMRRVQQGHNIQTSSFSKGILDNLHTDIQINAFHALELGGYYWEKQEFDMAIEWLNIAHSAIQASPIFKSHYQIESFIETLLVSAITHHNMYFNEKVNSKWEPTVFDKLVEYPFESHLYARRAHQLIREAIDERDKFEYNWATEINFKNLCAGNNLQSDYEKKSLKCWYDTNRHSYWRINPLKIEQLSLDPSVLQIYDFIGERLIEKIKQRTTKYLKRSEVVDITEEGPKIWVNDNTRTSVQTGIDDDQEENAYMRPLARRFELMSGLVIRPPEACDTWQVAVYGPSHFYNIHLDAFEDDDSISQKKGNRIVTIMGYLNDVNAGGRTAFPALGVYAEPVKGSIVIWEDLKRNGVDLQKQTWHGGCPVVLGVKWITNKWVYYNENIFAFGCTLNESD